MSPIIQPDDPDFSGPVPKKMVIPTSWLRRLAHVAKELRCAERSLIIQMVRASMALPEKAPIPEGPELRGVPQDNFWLVESRWKSLKKEAGDRGLTTNKVFQAHFSRGLGLAESQAAEEAAEGKHSK